MIGRTDAKVKTPRVRARLFQHQWAGLCVRAAITPNPHSSGQAMARINSNRSSPAAVLNCVSLRLHPFRLFCRSLNSSSVVILRPYQWPIAAGLPRDWSSGTSTNRDDSAGSAATAPRCSAEPRPSAGGPRPSADWRCPCARCNPPGFPESHPPASAPSALYGRCSRSPVAGRPAPVSSTRSPGRPAGAPSGPAAPCWQYPRQRFVEGVAAFVPVIDVLVAGGPAQRHRTPLYHSARHQRLILTHIHPVQRHQQGFLVLLEKLPDRPTHGIGRLDAVVVADRQHRLIRCLGSPPMRRPLLAGDARRTPVVALTRMESVLARDRRSDMAQTKTTHAVAFLRFMTDSWIAVPGRPCQAGQIGLNLFNAPTRQESKDRPGTVHCDLSNPLPDRRAIPQTALEKPPEGSQHRLTVLRSLPYSDTLGQRQVVIS